MLRFALILALPSIAFVHDFGRTVCAREFYVASWNLENLFDTVDDPNLEGDEEFTPDAPKKWTPERLNIKLGNQARIISKMNGGRGPDVLGLCEVENRQVVEMLVAKLAPLGRKYEIVHQDSPSDRGIDCALLYDANVFELIDSKFHFIDASRTRDIVEARLRHDGADLYVFMDHWPSRGNDEWQRCLAGVVLRKRLDQILAADPQADFLLLGDFNDEIMNVSLTKFLRVSPTPENLPAGTLYDTGAYLQAAGKGTYVYENKWDLLDHIIISPGLLDSHGYHWKPGSTQTVEFPEVFFHPRFPGAISRPSRSYSGSNFHKDGYSDHLAVGCVIVQ
ncbi:MAG: endonuclease/exonuclease/phosphatase family protein [Pirellulales bacterium]